MTTRKKYYYLYYTAAFLLTMCVAFLYFPLYKKTFVWKYDGLYQHYSSLAYYGKYLREIMKNLISQHKLIIPAWDMTIGYGSDVLTTLNYYVIGDPLCILSVAVSSNYTEYLYGFLILFRIYLAGVTFSVFCRYKKCEEWPTLIGAIAYAFCGFALFAATRHPSFGNPMIYLPLILFGVDLVFDGKSPLPYILTVTLCAVSNFYFFYMIVIIMVLYTVIDYVEHFQKIEVKVLSGWIFRFFVYSLIGVGMSCFVLVPMVMSVLSTDRMSAVHYIPKLYSLGFYAQLLEDFFGSDFLMASDKYWTILGFVPVTLVALFGIFLKMKKHIGLKVWFITLTLIMLIPYCGHIMNGFSYVSNRWGWGYAFVICFILVRMLPELFDLRIVDMIGLTILVVVYGGICALANSGLSLHTGVGLAETMITLIVVFMASFRILKEKAAYFIVFVLVVTGIGVNAYFLYSPQQTDYVSTFRDYGYPIKAITTSSHNQIMTTLEDDSCYRYDQYGVSARENTAMHNKVMGTDYYFSITNGAISEYFNDLRAHTVMEWMYNDLDGRSILDRLAAVKYFIVKNGEEYYLPYSYDQKVTANGSYTVYSTDDYLPFGYTYDAKITEEEFKSLSVTEKQQALLQAVVCDGAELENKDLEFTDVQPEMTVIPSEKITIDGDVFTVDKAKATITIKCDTTDYSEIYLLMDDVEYEGSNTKFNFTVTMDNVDKTIPVYTYRNSFYSGKDDFLCNIGYFEESSGEITLTFPAKGTYTIRNLKVVCQPMEETTVQVAALRENSLENMVIGDDEITGNIHVDQDKFLLLSVPYSNGWSVYIDGEKEDVYQANDMYLGCNIKAGDHQIRFCYSTPYLRAGICLSAFSLLILVMTGIMKKRGILK